MATIISPIVLGGFPRQSKPPCALARRLAEPTHNKPMAAVEPGSHVRTLPVGEEKKRVLRVRVFGSLVVAGSSS